MHFITQDDDVVPCAYDSGNDQYIVRVDDWEDDDVLVELVKRGKAYQISSFQLVYETTKRVIIEVEFVDDDSSEYSEEDEQSSIDEHSELSAYTISEYSDEDGYDDEEDCEDYAEEARRIIREVYNGEAPSYLFGVAPDE